MPKTCEIINDKHKGDKDKVDNNKNDKDRDDKDRDDEDTDKGDRIKNDCICLYHFPACRGPANNQWWQGGQGDKGKYNKSQKKTKAFQIARCLRPEK